MFRARVCVSLFLVSWLLALGEGNFASASVVKIGLRKRPRQLNDFISKTLTNKCTPLPLINNHNNFYYGPVNVGTPPQQVMLDFDTGSTDMFVSSIKMCEKPRYTQFCDTHDMYDNTKSLTYEENGKPHLFVYGSLALRGISSKDTFEINGLRVNGQMFLEMTDILGGQTVVDGIFGLAYPALARLESDPPFNQLVKQGLLKHAVFSFYLNNANDSCGVSEKEHDAELVLGGTDPEHYTGEITYTPVIEKQFWKIELNNVTFGGHSLVDSIPAIIDSGTTLIYGPSELIEVINNAIGGNMTEYGFTVDCSKQEEDLPVFSFTISSRKFDLSARDYIVRDDDICISAFMGSGEDDGSFLMGDVLMRRYYTVFDMEHDRVGFATAK